MGIATDFLQGYLFAAIIIIAGIGLLYYFGIFERQECVINGGFSCSNLTLSENGVSFIVTSTVLLDELQINVTSCGNSTLTNVTPHQLQKVQFSCNASKPFIADISLQYIKSNDTKKIFSTRGKIKG
jgi:hypothetical protein